MKDRLVKLLEKYDLSSSQFAEKIGVQRSSISHIMSGRNKPSYDFIIKILENFEEINSEWLLTGKGNILKIPGSSSISPNESDLFTQSSLNTPKSHENKPLESITQQQSITEKSENSPVNNIINSIQPNEVTNVNKVKFVVFVYEDDTFEILNKR